MKKKALMVELFNIVADSENDPITAHLKADILLMQYINDPQIEGIYNEIIKFYGCECDLQKNIGGLATNGTTKRND